MASVNKVILIGHLGRDPEKVTTNSGKTLVNISIATNDYFTDKTGSRQKKTEWHRIVLWEKLADVVSQYCKKGSSIYIEGSLRTNEWTDKEGQKRYTTQIVANRVQLLSDGSRTNMEGGADKAYDDNNFDNKDPFTAEPNVEGNEGFTEDDIPF